MERGDELEEIEERGSDEEASDCADDSDEGGFAEDHGGDLGVGEAVDAEDGDLADAREDGHDHGVGDAEAAEQQTASTDGPCGGFKDFELGVGAGELIVFERDEIGEVGLHHALELWDVVFVVELDGDDGRFSVFVEELLCGCEGHEDAAILEAVCCFDDANDMEGAVADLDGAAE